MDELVPQYLEDPSARPTPHDVSVWYWLRGAWITRAVLVASFAFSVAYWAHADRTSWDSLRQYGVLPVGEIWDGAVWPLFTSVFLHANLLHWALNAYWLALVGAAAERFLGPVRYASFAFAGIVSSAAQLAASSTMGIGASGVVYALIGFAWVGRRHVDDLRWALSGRQMVAALVWIVVGIYLTATETLLIGNAAHIAGLAVGLLAGAWRFGNRPRRAVSALAVASVVIVASGFICPWSVAWWAHEARGLIDRGEYGAAHEASGAALLIAEDDRAALELRGEAAYGMGAYAEALSDFDRAVAQEPSSFNLWCRGDAAFALGRFAEADADYGRALGLAPEEPRLYALRCETRTKLERFAEALADCDRALALNPGNADVERLRAAASSGLRPQGRR